MLLAGDGIDEGEAAVSVHRQEVRVVDAEGILQDEPWSFEARHRAANGVGDRSEIHAGDIHIVDTVVAVPMGLATVQDWPAGSDRTVML